MNRFPIIVEGELSSPRHRNNANEETLARTLAESMMDAVPRSDHHLDGFGHLYPYLVFYLVNWFRVSIITLKHKLYGPELRNGKINK